MNSRVSIYAPWQAPIFYQKRNLSAWMEPPPPLFARIKMIGWIAAKISLQRMASLIPHEEQGMSVYFSVILYI